MNSRRVPKPGGAATLHLVVVVYNVTLMRQQDSLVALELVNKRCQVVQVFHKYVTVVMFVVFFCAGTAFITDTIIDLVANQLNM